jgi:hypothetical protein
MKASLKSLAPKAQPEAVPTPTPETVKSYATAKTRTDTRQLSGHFPSGDVQAFRVLAAENDMDVQELLAEAMNMTFERYGRPNRIPVTSGRRKRSA